MIGIDEVGRGSLVGEVYACACYFDEKVTKIDGIKDSKKLTPSKRNLIFERVLQDPSVKFAIGVASLKEIEDLNILNATLLAMERAFLSLGINDVEVLIDGNKKPPNLAFAKTIVGGDDLIPQISLASIIAKVLRDEKMNEISKQVPMYDIANNKGYGTKKHFDAIFSYGISKFHRNKFLKKLAF